MRKPSSHGRAIVFDRMCGGFWNWTVGPLNETVLERSHLGRNSSPSCAVIEETDGNANLSVIESCVLQCEYEFGTRPTFEVLSPYCGMRWETGQLRQFHHACAKARFAMLFKAIRGWEVRVFGSVCYFALGFVLAFLGILYTRTRGYRSLQVHIRQDGVTKGLEKLGLPCCCLPSKSDACRARLQVWIAVAGAMMDNFLDVQSLAVFAKAGQPYFFVATLVSILASSGMDILQYNKIVSAVETLERGIPTRAYLKHTSANSPEASTSVLVNAVALANMAKHTTLWCSDAVVLGVSLASSLGLALPNASVAQYLMNKAHDESGDLLQDYARCEEIKHSLHPATKYFAAVRAFTYASCAAVCIAVGANSCGGMFAGYALCRTLESRRLWDVFTEAGIVVLIMQPGTVAQRTANLGALCLVRLVIHIEGRFTKEVIASEPCPSEAFAKSRPALSKVDIESSH